MEQIGFKISQKEISSLREHNLEQKFSIKNYVLNYHINLFLLIRPACQDMDMLLKMIDGGMNVARLNFAYGDHKGHEQALENLRDALKQSSH